jgi:hypothetical protein
MEQSGANPRSYAELLRSVTDLLSEVEQVARDLAAGRPDRMALLPDLASAKVVSTFQVNQLSYALVRLHARESEDLREVQRTVAEVMEAQAQSWIQRNMSGMVQEAVRRVLEASSDTNLSTRQSGPAVGPKPVRQYGNGFTPELKQ